MIAYQAVKQDHAFELGFNTVSQPDFIPHHHLVKIKYIAMNHIDYKMIDPHIYNNYNTTFPMTLGTTAIGTLKMIISGKPQCCNSTARKR